MQNMTQNQASITSSVLWVRNHCSITLQCQVGVFLQTAHSTGSDEIHGVSALDIITELIFQELLGVRLVGSE